MDFYLFTKGEERGPYSRRQLQTMWESGAVTSNSVYWHEGMVERRRVSELFEPPTDPGAPFPPAPQAAAAVRPVAYSPPVTPPVPAAPSVAARAASPYSFAPFVLALLCFLLPFAEVSCQGHRLLALSGAQMVVGAEVDSPVPFGQPRKIHVDPQPLAVLAFGCALLGLAVCFGKNVAGALAATACGGLGFLFLLMLRWKLDDETLKNGRGLIGSEYLAGFYLECFFLLAAVALNGFLLRETLLRKNDGRRGSAPPLDSTG